jgi:hypothetical protein
LQHLLRIINVAISLIVAYFVFNGLYDEYYSYLPDYSKLEGLNNAPTIASVLRENSNNLRDLYNHAFEKSLTFSIISFIISLLILEYIRTGNILAAMFNNVRNDYRDIKEPKPIKTLDE